MSRRVERIAIMCGTCGVTFHERASRKRKFCGKKCEGIALAKKYAAERVERTCQHCGAVFRSRKERTYCSFACHQVGIARASAKKRGDRLRGTGEGRSYIKQDGRHQHRVIAEEKIGRPLAPGEVVHHKDNNKRNNEPDNLVVLPSQREHARVHNFGRRRKV